MHNFSMKFVFKSWAFFRREQLDSESTTNTSYLYACQERLFRSRPSIQRDLVPHTDMARIHSSLFRYNPYLLS
jgi:hypothetical protein